MIRSIAISIAFIALCTNTSEAQVKMNAADSALSRAILKELVEIKSVSGSPQTIDAAQAAVKRLRAAGFSEQDAFVRGKTDSVGNVVVRLKGNGTAKPIMLMAHLDVVPALREDWTTDPFVMTEKDGWWYGRGTIDNKDGATTIIANMIRWKRDGFVPDRDIIGVITGDEETLSDQIQWFAAEGGRKYIGDPELAVNFDAGGGTIYNGKPATLDVQTSEKVYASYRLTARNPGGHSSQPRPDNAIYQLARALNRLDAYKFPLIISPITRLSLQRSAAFEDDSIARLMRLVAQEPMDPGAAARLTRITRFNAQLRTTCVATRLTGGHADNALPQMAQATVNCRILPGTDTSIVVRAIRTAIADPEIEVTEVLPATVSPPSPLPASLLTDIETVAKRFWPGVVVVPTMSSGATDGSYVRNQKIPVYGIGGIFTEASESRAHGRDERLEIRRFYEGVDFAKAMIERLSKK